MSTSGAGARTLPSTPRRPWLRLGMLLAVVALALGATGLCVAWLAPRQSGPTFATFPLADLEVGRPQFFRPFNMGYDGGYGLGMWLVLREDGGVNAFFSRDTHSGSQTQHGTYQGQPGFRGLRTGSFYDRDGRRLFGPAPRGLDGFETSVSDGLVEIDMTTIILGQCAPAVIEDCSTSRERVTRSASWPGGE